MADILMEALRALRAGRELKEANENVKERTIKDIDEFINLAKENKQRFLVSSETGDLYAIGEEKELKEFIAEFNDYELGEFDFHIYFEDDKTGEITEQVHFFTKDDNDVKKILREVCGYEFPSSIWDTLIEKFGNKNNKYLLIAEGYDRAPGGSGIYKKRFNAPNDYIALMSMSCHSEPTEEAFIDYFGDDFSEYPQTYEEMLKYASSNWWGDGDDYIILLENLSEDTTLYEGDE